MADIKELLDQRVALENALQNEKAELSESRVRDYDRRYANLQRQLAVLFKEASSDPERITLMLEMMRILENRLVYLHNFIVDPTSDNRILAQLVTKFIDQIARDRSTVLTTLESTYYRAVASLYAGDLAAAREGFTAACESEESDEANDIKYKSYVILGHLSHEEHDYAKAKALHDESLRYTQNGNVTAQALALKALNAYALGDYDEAVHLFEDSLRLFDHNEPFFNSYFYRNALLFCGAIYFDRKDYAPAEELYKRALETVDQNSYDHFDALSHLGRPVRRSRRRARESRADASIDGERVRRRHLVLDRSLASEARGQRRGANLSRKDRRVGRALRSQAAGRRFAAENRVTGQ
jgi:tetratricopeptide (TPR) repeat protein